MRSIGRMVTLSAALALGGCISQCDCAPNPPAIPQSNLPLGSGCVSTAECAAGLECWYFSSERDFGQCYLGCAGNPGVCPAGSYCEPTHGACEVQCASDADCPVQQNLLTCQGWNANEGCWAHHCDCGHYFCYMEGDCPAGSRCVQGEAQGDLSPTECQPGFCQAL